MIWYRCGTGRSLSYDLHLWTTAIIRATDYDLHLWTTAIIRATDYDLHLWTTAIIRATDYEDVHFIFPFYIMTRLVEKRNKQNFKTLVLGVNYTHIFHS